MTQTTKCQRKVLVVEDDDDAREIVCSVLEDASYTAVGARHGAEALRLLDMEWKPCAILLDLTMPVMDGWTFRTEQLRRPDLARIPVVLLSAIPDLPHQAGRLGVTDFVKKPVRLDTLLQVVAVHCG